MKDRRKIYRALLSVFDKHKLAEFAQQLSIQGVELLATEGTALFLEQKGLSVTKVSDYTNFPEIMQGKIKTLHPKIHGGILGCCRQDNNIMNYYRILPIDMVVVNFYPFSEIVLKKQHSLENALKNIDIGGPSIMRAAAKNYKNVAIIFENSDYDDIIKEMSVNQGSLKLSTRFCLAIKAFQYIHEYDASIANYFLKLKCDYSYKEKHTTNDFPNTLNFNFIKKQNIRYGENNHQKAAFYVNQDIENISISTAKQLQGKQLSYNNIVDANVALECVKEFRNPACVIVKHENPCGVAVSNSILTAYDRAYQADPVSAFGGIIAFNRNLDLETTKEMISRQFIEVIIAPSISKKALQITSSKENMRVLICGKWCKDEQYIPSFDFKSVNGGLLVQERDIQTVGLKELRIVSQRQPDEQELRDSLFSWKVVKFVKSNAVVYAKENMTIGIGAGQMSRVFSAKIAGIKAKENKLQAKNCVMASDAFFSFHDGIDPDLGITCIIQPGGSIRDDKVINFVNKYNIAMIFTGIRHFRH